MSPLGQIEVDTKSTDYLSGSHAARLKLKHIRKAAGLCTDFLLSYSTTRERSTLD